MGKDLRKLLLPIYFEDLKSSDMQIIHAIWDEFSEVMPMALAAIFEIRSHPVESRMGAVTGGYRE